MRRISKRWTVVLGLLFSGVALAAFTDDTYLGIQYILNGTGTLTVPANVTDTLVARATTDTLTNKTLSTASNTISATADRAAHFGPAGALQASTAVSTTELEYLDGVTSAIQTQVDGKQGLDATLTALAAYSTNGLLAQTSADTFAGRTITGTANQVSVSNGDGVSGNPTLSTPQNIHTAATPTFASLTLTNQLLAAQLLGRISSTTYMAADFQNPVTADWTVNSLAGFEADSVSSGIQVRAFDDTTAECVGFTRVIPTNSTSITFHWTGKRAGTGSVQSIVWSFYAREMTDAAAIEAWGAEDNSAAISLPNTLNYAIDSENFTFSTLGIASGSLAQFEMCRDPTNGSDDLTGDFRLVSLEVEFR